MVRLKAKARACSYGAEDRDEQITLQLIKGLKWTEVRRKLLEKGNNLSLEAAIKIALANQATTNRAFCFKQKSIDAVKRHNCLRCGSSHPPWKCLAYGKKCTKCGQTNHFEKMCQTGKFRKQKAESRNGKEANSSVDTVATEDSTLDCDSVTLATASTSTNHKQDERQAIMVKLDVRPPKISQKVTLTVKADTGANGNILPT